VRREIAEDIRLSDESWPIGVQRSPMLASSRDTERSFGDAIST
jgi:hypothetical protein